MPKKQSIYKTIHTVDGITLNLYEDSNGVTKPHCATGPAIIYPKGINKPDEYFLFGIKYEYDKWLEHSKPLRRNLTKEDFID